jgi:hypothetical protein
MTCRPFHADDAYIFDAIRTPRGRGRKDGALHEVTAVRLSADILNALKDRNGLPADAVEDVIWGNVTQVMRAGRLPRALGRAALRSRRDDPRPLDQPLLRLRPRGGEPRREPGEGRRRRGLCRGRRRDDVAACRWARTAPRSPPTRRSPSRPISCPRASPPTSSRPSTASPATMSTPSPSRARPRAHRAWEEGRFARSVVPVRDRNGLPLLERDEHPRPGHRHAVARRAQPVVQGDGRDDAGLRRGGDPEVSASRAHRPRPPCRQLLGHRRRRRRGAGRDQGMGRAARPEAAGAHPRDGEGRHRPDHHADRPGSGDREGARRGRHGRSAISTSSRSTRRSRRSSCASCRPSTPIRRGSTRTAAPSPWDTRSAPPAR